MNTVYIDVLTNPHFRNVVRSVGLASKTLKMVLAVSLLKNGVPQGSVLAPLLFNVYTSDLPEIIGTKLAYSDDLAILHLSKSFEEVEATLSLDVTFMDCYYHTTNGIYISMSRSQFDLFSTFRTVM